MPKKPEDPQALAFKIAMNERKLQAAKKAGLDDKVRDVGWKNMSAAECGKIGGLMGGKIGGQMVKKMLELINKEAVKAASDK